MRISGVCSDRPANRICRLALLVALTVCGAAFAAGPAAADSTWTGTDASAAVSPNTNWSDPANWGGVAPVAATAGVLSFPPLSATACPSGVTVVCYSNNDLSSAIVTTLDIDAADNYDITGNHITLMDGINTLSGTDQGGQATLAVPITLGAANTWNLTATTTNVPDYLDVVDPLSGATADTLAISLANHNALALNGDNEVGNVTITGSTPADGCSNGGVDLRFGGSLNATDGGTIAITDAGMQTEGGTIGALTAKTTCMSLGNNSAPTGELTATSATFDSNSSILFRVIGDGGAGNAGSTYGALVSTGTIDLAGAGLNISNIADSTSCTSPPAAGTAYTLVSAGTLTGTFGNAPNGETIGDDCANSPDEYVINYTATTVTATLKSAPTTTVVASPTNPVTNQTVTLTATITPNGNTATGTVDFEQGGATIPGCGAVTASGGSPDVATCHASFAAASSPVAVTAVFTQTGSASGTTLNTPYNLSVGKDATSTALAVSSATPAIGETVTYTATVTPADAGPTEPSGGVEFFDGSTGVGACPSQPLTAGSSSSTATCTISYGSADTHSITAKYLGDASFNASAPSPAQTVVVSNAPTITIKTPKAGGEYTRGQVVHASYSCVAAPGFKLVSCKGTVAGGKSINTKAYGKHTFTVAASDGSAFGESSSVRVTYTVVSKPSLSHASIHGLASKHGKLAFTATAGKDAAGFKTIAIAPPGGITFSSKKGIVVKGSNGKPLKFSAKVSKGTLTITLKSSAKKVQLTLASPAMKVSSGLAGKVARGKTKSVTFTVSVTDAAATKTKLKLKLKKIS